MATPYMQIDLQITVGNSRGVVQRWPYSKKFDVQTEVVPGAEYVIPVATEKTIWNALDTNQQLTDFSAIVLVSDQDLDMELVVDKGGEVGAEYESLFLAANVPFLLGGSRAFANFTTDVFAGTADKIEEISVKNQSATLSAKLQLFMVDDT